MTCWCPIWTPSKKPIAKQTGLPAAWSSVGAWSSRIGSNQARASFRKGRICFSSSLAFNLSTSAKGMAWDTSNLPEVTRRKVAK